MFAAAGAFKVSWAGHGESLAGWVTGAEALVSLFVTVVGGERVKQVPPVSLRSRVGMTRIEEDRLACRNDKNSGVIFYV
jgi:hypothetical protein